MSNLINWIEIPAKNITRAAKFYEAVLNIELKISGQSDEKMACFPAGGGAISQSKGFEPSTDGVLVSFDLGNRLDAAITNAIEQNGTVIQKKNAVTQSDGTYFALIKDSEGNRIGLHGII